MERLIGLTERADSLGGTLTAGPTVEDGFELVLDVPLTPTPPALLQS